MFLVLLERFGVNQDVVKVPNSMLIQEISQNIVDEVLDGCGGIEEPKGHYLPFK